MANQEETRTLALHVGVHRGPAMVTTFNDHLDYFGATVKASWQLPALAGDGEVVLSQAVASEPFVAAWLRGRRLKDQVFSASLGDGPDDMLHRLKAK